MKVSVFGLMVVRAIGQTLHQTWLLFTVAVSLPSPDVQCLSAPKEQYPLHPLQEQREHLVALRLSPSHPPNFPIPAPWASLCPIHHPPPWPWRSKGTSWKCPSRTPGPFPSTLSPSSAPPNGKGRASRPPPQVPEGWAQWESGCNWSPVRTGAMFVVTLGANVIKSLLNFCFRLRFKRFKICHTGSAAGWDLECKKGHCITKFVLLLFNHDFKIHLFCWF